MATSDAERAELGHLMRRAAFGVNARELDAAVGRGYESTVDSLVPAAPAAVAAPSLPAQSPQRQQIGALQLWWLDRLVRSEQPLVERLTLFWHGHWATSAQKVKSAALMLAQNQTLRRLGLGDFRELARAMVRDPAMLIWLDAGQNKPASPNENLGRELMELFTLGIGNYTDTDVKEAARALTGWRVNRQTGKARFVARQHDAKDKTVLGHTGNLDDRSLVDLLVGTDASRRFVVARLWFRLAGPVGPDAATMDRLLAAYGPGRDLRALVRALLLDPAFRSDAVRHALVTEPVVYAVGAMRALRVAPSALSAKDQRALLGSLKAMGQELFLPPSVGGWPSGQGWLATSAAQARLAFAQALARAADLSTVDSAARGSRVDAAAHLLSVPQWSDRTRRVLAEVGDPAQVVALALASPEYTVG